MRNADEAVVLIACATSYVLDYDQSYRTVVPANINYQVKPGAKMAQAYFNAPGWVLAMMTNTYGWTSPGGEVGWGSFFGGSGWICRHFWEHYAYTQDEEFLKWAYPVMKGACEFYLAAMIEDKEGYLIPPKAGPRVWTLFH